jgi:hypothetical protein
MSEPAPSAAPEPQPATTTRDRVLLVAFWAWAVLLVVATLAQLLDWQGVKEFLDVKNWFAR